MNIKAVADRITQEYAAKLKSNVCPVCGVPKDPKENLCESCQRRDREVLKDITEGRR